jgi:hypothetical protein
LDFLSKPHKDTDLVNAAKEVLEHIGTAVLATCAVDKRLMRIP